jgi:hypothetical protein
MRPMHEYTDYGAVMRASHWDDPVPDWLSGLKSANVRVAYQVGLLQCLLLVRSNGGTSSGGPKLEERIFRRIDYSSAVRQAQRLA